MPEPSTDTVNAEAYREVIRRVAGMVADRNVQNLAHQHGLHVLNVTWEDTARFKGSAVGPNISDMTIQVQHQVPGTDGDEGRYELSCMPVIRFPNFSDLSGDVDPERFYLLVGNEKGEPLRRVTLREMLGDLRQFLSDADSWAGERTSLLCERDTHVLVSAQACFLPIPQQGIAEFNPVLFNYQSRQGDPAVLTILATREGTSVTVIDNTRDAFEAGRTWGQRLFFNENGQRASLTGTRKSDFARQVGETLGESAATEVLDGEGLNMVLLIQVPLKQKERELRVGGTAAYGVAYCMPPTRGGSAVDVEEAVIGHGRVEGPFTEVDGLEIERDDRYPVRVTVQFYKATSNGLVGEEDMAQIAEQIARVYREADYVGSLVVDGETGRPTEHAGQMFEPPDWWEQFWRKHFAETGQTREAAVAMLERLLGPAWADRTEAEADAAFGSRDES